MVTETQNGFLTLGYWVDFRGMAAMWVTGWVSEAWSLDGFLRNGHLKGFRGMVAGWVSEAWSLGGFKRHGMATGWMGF